MSYFSEKFPHLKVPRHVSLYYIFNHDEIVSDSHGFQGKRLQETRQWTTTTRAQAQAPLAEHRQGSISTLLDVSMELQPRRRGERK